VRAEQLLLCAARGISFIYVMGCDMSLKIFRLPKVMDESGLARSTVYLRIKQGLLTTPISLGPRCVGWPQTEIEAINAARIAEQSEDEIRALVTQLQKSRKHDQVEVAK
jgi:prophage regulatory protein